jgi:hypothetical protein
MALEFSGYLLAFLCCSLGGVSFTTIVFWRKKTGNGVRYTRIFGFPGAHL